jgi:hypothetical protein
MALVWRYLAASVGDTLRPQLEIPLRPQFLQQTCDSVETSPSLRPLFSLLVLVVRLLCLLVLVVRLLSLLLLFEVLERPFIFLCCWLKKSRGLLLLGLSCSCHSFEVAALCMLQKFYCMVVLLPFLCG